MAAIDNDTNVVGVAAGATVIPVRILKSNGYGTGDTAIAGIDYMAQQAQSGEAANMSAGGGIIIKHFMKQFQALQISSRSLLLRAMMVRI